MINIGFFSEMHVSMCDSGSVKNYIADKVDYDKKAVVNYLSSFGRQAVCPRYAIDCVTGEEIASSFSVNDDGEYCWPDFLIYHIEKYNIRLPEKFVKKIMSKTV